MVYTLHLVNYSAMGTEHRTFCMSLPWPRSKSANIWNTEIPKVLHNYQKAAIIAKNKAY